MAKKLMILAHYVNVQGMSPDETKLSIEKRKDDYIEDEYYDIKNIFLESDHNDIKCIFPLDGGVKINMATGQKPSYNKYDKYNNSSSAKYTNYNRSDENTSY